MRHKMSPESIIHTIKLLSSSMKCKNNVFSNQIFKNLLVPIFSKETSPYTLTYGDFNGLYSFNKTHGNDAGTQAIKDSISVIQEKLSDKTITVRIAGDEFVFLTPSSEADVVKKQLDEASEILKCDSETYLTMAFGVVNSSEIPNIYDMYTLAEQRQSVAKLESKNFEYSKDVMRQKLDENFNQFFNNYRFSNKFELSIPHIKQLGDLSLKSAMDLILSEDLRNKQLEIRNNTELSTLNAPTVPLFTPAQAELLFDYINDPNEDPDKSSNLLSNLYSTQINKFFTELIVNPNSGFLNGTYYDLFFKPNITNDNFRPATIISLDVTNIKDCNAKTSHLETDQRLTELSAEVEDYLTDKFDISFNTDRFSIDDTHNYIFNRQGGEFLIVLGEKSLSPKEMFDFLTDINGVNITPMHVLSAYTTNQSIPYNQSIENLETDLKTKKRNFLEYSISTAQTKASINLFIADSVEFFINNCPNSSDINSQKEFLEQLVLSLTDQALNSNKEFLESKKDDIEK